MEDRTFNNLLKKLGKAHDKYCELLSIAENEFKERYGGSPDDLNYNPWIDNYYYNQGVFLTLEDLDDPVDGVLASKERN